jgi:heat-inducible transcriptional repressor
MLAIEGRVVVLVLVFQGGAVHQQMLTLTDAVSQITLTEAAARINTICADLGANDVRIKSVHLQLLEREVAELAADLMDKSDNNLVRLVYRDGLSDVISSFQHSEGAQQMVRVFEERSFLNSVLSELLSPLINNVQVVIAGNGRWDELSHLTLIFSRYGIPGQAMGTLGLLGPTHINYGRAISTVRYVSGVMTEMLENLYETGDKTE